MITYKIQGRDVREYGVVVSEGVGLLDPLTPKKNPYRQLERYTHGEFMNRQKVYFEARKIVLKCSILADTPTQFAERMNNLKSLLYVGGTFRLEVITPAVYPLEYEVYCNNAHVDGNVAWRDGKMVAKLTIHLVEPEPVKRVYRVNNSSQEVVVENPKNLLINVYRSPRAQNANEIPRIAIEKKDRQIRLFPPFEANDYIIISGDLDSNDGINTSNATLIWK